RLTQVRGRPGDQRAKGPDHRLGPAGLVELDASEPGSDRREGLLELLLGRGPGRAPPAGERLRLPRAREEDLVGQHEARLRQVEAWVLGGRRDDRDGVAEVERLVREAAVLPAEEERDGGLGGVARTFTGVAARGARMVAPRLRRPRPPRDLGGG